MKKAINLIKPEAIYSYHQGMTRAAECGIAAAWNKSKAKLLVLVNADEDSTRRFKAAGFERLRAVAEPFVVKSLGGDKHYAHVFVRTPAEEPPVEANKVGLCIHLVVLVCSCLTWSSCFIIHPAVLANCVPCRRVQALPYKSGR